MIRPYSLRVRNRRSSAVPFSSWLRVRKNLDSCVRRNDKVREASPFLHAWVENPPYIFAPFAPLREFMCLLRAPPSPREDIFPFSRDSRPPLVVRGACCGRAGPSRLAPIALYAVDR